MLSTRVVVVLAAVAVVMVLALALTLPLAQLNDSEQVEAVVSEISATGAAPIAEIHAPPPAVAPRPAVQEQRSPAPWPAPSPSPPPLSKPGRKLTTPQLDASPQWLALHAKYPNVQMWVWPEEDLTQPAVYCRKHEAVESGGRCMPYFIITGSFKCGTTSMYKYLSMHPQVKLLEDSNNVVRTKETRMLAGLPIPLPPATLIKYLAFFPVLTEDDVTAHRWVTGEASPNYITHQTSPLNIKDVVPHAYLIHMLREPIQRAASQSDHFLGLNIRDRTTTNFVDIFVEAVTLELSTAKICMQLFNVTPQANSCENYAGLRQCLGAEVTKLKPTSAHVRAILNLHTVTRGLYWLSLCNFATLFPEALTHIVVSEDLYAGAAKVMQRVTAFLRLDPIDWNPIVSVKYNVGRAVEQDRKLGLVPEAPNISEHKLPPMLVCALQEFYEPWNDLLRLALNRPELWRDKLITC